MKVLVDTSVWSLALRRSNPDEKNSYVYELRELIGESRVQMVGPIRQEVLSGIRSIQQFERLRDYLRSFPDLELSRADFELAADFFNVCRKKGIQGSNTDFLLCAIGYRHRLSLLTNDGDFQIFGQYLPVRLHEPREYE